MNFFVLRLTLNLGFALGILSFFVTGSVAGLVAGAVLQLAQFNLVHLPIL